jgi:hypothetical protein
MHADERMPPFPRDERNLQSASGRISAVIATQPMATFGGVIIAAVLVLIGVNDMSNHALSFESAQIGAAPEGWTATLTGSGDPKWTVESEASAPSKSKVIKQSGRATYPLLLKDDTSIKDGFVQVKFKAIAGSQDRAAGIIWRAKDANNYYVTRANALEDNVVLYKTVNGVRSPRHCRPDRRIRNRCQGSGRHLAQLAHRLQRLTLQRILQRQAIVRGRGFHIRRCRQGGTVDQGRQRHTF